MKMMGKRPIQECLLEYCSSSRMKRVLKRPHDTAHITYSAHMIIQDYYADRSFIFLLVSVCTIRCEERI